MDLSAGHFLYRSGDASKALYTLQEGWAGVCMDSPGEPPRLMDVLLPGDLIGVPASISGTHLRSVVALTPSRYCVLDPSLTRQLAEQGGPFAFALMRLLVEQRMQRERMSNLLRNGNPLQRLAYFFLETFRRLQGIGTAAETMCPFPLRRVHLAQIVGLSEVHVSRTLATMRRDKLVDIANNILFIPDEARLTAVANVSLGPCPRERLIL